MNHKTFGRARNVYTMAVLASVMVWLIPVGFAHSQEQEIIINRKPLSKWIKQIKGSNRGLQVRAARALIAAPKAAHPKIIEALIPVLKSERQNNRFVAAQVLGECGPAARVAVANLVPLLKGTQFERNRAAAAKALGQILKDAKPSEAIEKVTKNLVSVFRDSYPDVQRESVKACGMIGPAARSCLPHLVKPLEYNKRGGSQDVPYAMVRREASWTLGRMGALSKKYIDRLIALMHVDTMPATVEAMGRIGVVHENVVPNIVDKMEACGRGALAFRLAAMKALEGFGPKSAPAVPFVMRYLGDELNRRGPISPLVGSCRVLGKVGPAAKAALPVLQKASTHKFHPHAGISQADHDKLHKAAKEAIAAITGQSEKANTKDED